MDEEPSHLRGLAARESVTEAVADFLRQESDTAIDRRVAPMANLAIQLLQVLEEVIDEVVPHVPDDEGRVLGEWAEAIAADARLAWDEILGLPPADEDAKPVDRRYT